MILTHKQSCEYLNSKKYNIIDKKKYLNCLTYEKILEIYFYCIEQFECYEFADGIRMSLATYPQAKAILLDFIQYLEYLEDSKNENENTIKLD